LSYRLSASAKRDITSILFYTQDEWGPEQAERYYDSLLKAFRSLSASPRIGMVSDSIARGLRRFPVEQHVVFYKIEKTGILIVRLLHKRMLPLRERFLSRSDK
jgi:toxin ParE1/3/4